MGNGSCGKVIKALYLRDTRALELCLFADGQTVIMLGVLVDITGWLLVFRNWLVVVVRVKGRSVFRTQGG